MNSVETYQKRLRDEVSAVEKEIQSRNEQIEQLNKRLQGMKRAVELFETEEPAMAELLRARDTLSVGEVGSLWGNIKDLHSTRIGDTITEIRRPTAEPLAGFAEAKPMVFAGLFPTDADDYANLRDAMEKLRLNDASFSFVPENSTALGFGFRCGRGAATGTQTASILAIDSTSGSLTVPSAEVISPPRPSSGQSPL